MWDQYGLMAQYGQQPQNNTSVFTSPMGLNSMSAPSISGFQLPQGTASSFNMPGMENGNLFGWKTPFFSTSDQQGWGGMGLGAAQGIFNAFMGMKQYGLAKDQLREGKKQFALNYDAQAGTTRAAMSGQKEANLRAQGVTGGALTSQLASYMDQYAPKDRG